MVSKVVREGLMRLSRVRCTGVPLFSVFMVACSSPTSPTVHDVLAHQAIWAAQHLGTYSFTFQVWASTYPIECPTAEWQITVQQGTATGSACLATGQATSTPRVTIDSLFADALAAASAQRLSTISFDPVRGYPTEIDYAGPPDAAPVFRVTSLRP
jgi:Family of unknown function (DUF6174)